MRGSAPSRRREIEQPLDPECVLPPEAGATASDKARARPPGSKTAARDEDVRAAFRDALDRMRESGHDVGPGVHVAVDPRLPIMGYSFPSGEGFQIVVSGGAVESGMLEGLIVHEMSHIYRMRTRHPSHNGRVIEEAVNAVADGVATRDYQKKILHDLVNNVEDLYADDISFNVLKGNGSFTVDRMSRFLQDWVEDEPVRSRDPRRDRWANAWLVANNARAIAQMARHGVPDIDGVADAANRKLLSRLPPAAAQEFEYFRDLLANLREDLTLGEYRRLLVDYLTRFVELAEPA
jgi:hypothetical protein